MYAAFGWLIITVSLDICLEAFCTMLPLSFFSDQFGIQLEKNNAVSVPRVNGWTNQHEVNQSIKTLL